MGSTRARRNPCVTFLLIGVAILALVLGLGLGLGLKHHHKSTDAAVQSTPPNGNSSSSSNSTLPFLQPQPQSNFVLNNSIQEQSPQTRVYNFTVDQANGAPDGVNRTMFVVNGMFPGPTIEINQGDRLIVNVQNNLPNATAIHWHGLFQNGTNFYDGTEGITQCGIPPGKSLTYNFTLGEFFGTTWWHAHASTQYTDGITGALIVHPTSPPPSNLPTWDEELVVQINDWYHDQSSVLLAQYLSPEGIAGTQGNEPVPDSGTINGLGQYFAAGNGGSYSNFTLERGKTYRIRIINTGSFASIRFSVDDHPLTLIEADGTYLKPTPVAGVIPAIAQRYSVLLHANATASPNATYWMRASVQSDMFTYDQPGQNLDIRGIIRYNDAPSSDGLPGDPSSPDPGPGSDLADADGTTDLTPLVPDPAPEVTRAYDFTVSFQFVTDAVFLGFMNSTSWDPLQNTTTLLQTAQNPQSYTPTGSSIAPDDQFIIAEDDIIAVDLRIDNLDDGDHPFHLHGHRPWIMGSGAGRYIGQELNNTNPLRRDTILIPAYSYMVLRYVTDNPGLWAFHCHIAWHMAAGLLMQVSSLPSKAAQLDIPQDIISQCAQN